jgi:hypothetical protein
MQLYSLDSVRSELESGGYVVKFLAHDQAVVFFPRTTEHREAGVQGLTYKDDSKGNALAGMMSPGRIEFRSHARFSDERVRNIALAMVNLPDLKFTQGFQVIYQGRVLIDGQQGLPTPPAR